MMVSNQTTGIKGEAIAVDFLKRQKYKILEQNFRTPFGEIDIIAKDRKTLCFIEVKTRNSHDYGDPLEAITKRKQHTMARTAYAYLGQKKLEDIPVRFDIVTVDLSVSAQPKVEVLKDAFEISLG